MPSMPDGLSEKLAQLLAYFHGGSLDVPDGLIARECAFRLNGVADEQTLGRPLSDPLIRLLGRGPAAYRFLAQGLRYAVPDLHIEFEELQDPDRGGLLTGIALLTGLPRGAMVPLVASADIALVTDTQGRVTEVGVQVDAHVVRTLVSARAT